MKFNKFTGKTSKRRAGQGGFTLIEVVFASAIAALVLAGMFEGYTMAGRQAQFSACNAAASAMAEARMEQLMAASWVPSYSDNQLLSVAYSATPANLCLPSAGGNVVTCTNYTYVTNMSTSPPYAKVRVDCVWSFPTYGGVFTNTVCVLRAPDS